MMNYHPQNNMKIFETIEKKTKDFQSKAELSWFNHSSENARIEAVKWLRAVLEETYAVGLNDQYVIMKNDLIDSLNKKILEMESKKEEMLDSEAGFIAGLRWIIKEIR